MKTPLGLLVLMICCLAQTQSRDPAFLLHAPNVESRDESAQTGRPRTEAKVGEPERLDVWDELRDLRDMVVQQTVELRHVTDRLTAAESLVQALQRENEAMEARMTAAERLAEELQMENEAQAAELGGTQQTLSAVQGRLTASESRTEQLEKQQEGQQAAVQELQNANIVSKVAFSASLLASGQGNVGNKDADVHLIYRNVFTNIGNHYNVNTGYFTVPVKGVYFFRFTGHLAHSDRSMRIGLVKNGHPIVITGDRATTSSADAEDNASNGVVLHLEEGDVVSLNLIGYVWDDQYHRTTFSGFLLFPL